MVALASSLSPLNMYASATKPVWRKQQVNNSAHMEIDQEIRLVADGGQDGEFVQAVVSKPVYGVIT